MKNVILATIVVLFIGRVHAQEKQSIASIENEASDEYNSKNYDLATEKYLEIIELSDFKSQQLNAIYNAACCLALQNKVDSAYIFLQRAIDYGFTYKAHIVSDTDLDNLHSNPKWEKLLLTIPEGKSLNSNPDLAKIITKDIHNFWEAYDKAKKDSVHTRAIYQEFYFDRASDGMEDYMGGKVGSIDYFINHIQSHPQLYQTIRENTLKVDEYKKDIHQSFKNFKELYPEAKFPDVYFVIGAFTSGGTVSPSGLLIGTNQMSDGKNVNTEELDFGDKLLMNKSKYLPHIVAHELIHFQQDGMINDTITLGYAINEGMADFLGELISGDTANRKIFEWAKGKEKQIWTDFKKDMLYDRYNKWIANYSSASEDSYPDLGYWIGYEICKSYYETAEDKKQAIYDMLHIQDFQTFLIDSKWEVKLDKMN